MEQTNNNYPRFEKGQVLTSQVLNSYFGYLDEQQRLTRAKFLGVGIIDGLDVNHLGNKLTIKKGSAVTADGYLIELHEDITYTVIHEYDKKSAILTKQNPLSDTADKDFETVLENVDYVFYKDKSDATKHNVSSVSHYYYNKDLMDKHDIALMVDFASQDTITECSELSCDIVQSNYQIEIRPVLIKKTFIGNDYSTNLLTSDIEVSLDKITAGIVLNPKHPLEFFKETYAQLKESISSGVKQVYNIFTHFGKLLFNDVSLSEVQQLNNYFLFYFDRQIEQEYNNKTARFSGYYLDFLIQFRMAIREFLTTYYEFIWKYKTIPDNTKTFPRIVLVGPERFRRQERIIQDNTYMDDLTVLRKHFYRIVSMYDSFYVNIIDCIHSISNKELSYFYIRKGAKLGERDIPGFYDIAKCNYWQAHSHAESSLFSYKNWPDKFEQAPILSEYYLIFDNYYGKSLYDFNRAFHNKYYKSLTRVHYIHVDDYSKSEPDFFGYNEPGYPEKKTEYKKRMYAVHDKSKILNKSKNKNSIFKDIIELIIGQMPINYTTNSLLQLCSDIDHYLQVEIPEQIDNHQITLADSSAETNLLDRTKRFLSQFCDIRDEIIMIGGCSSGGDLYVFYSGYNDGSGYGKDNCIVLIVGTC